MNAFRRQFEVVRHLGLPWAAGRMWHAVKKKSGILRIQTPNRPVAHEEPAPAAVRDFLINQIGTFFVAPATTPSRDVLTAIAGDAGVARTLNVADDFAAGRFLYYSHSTVDHGNPVNWLRVPTAGGSHHADLHWTRYPTFSESLGDVKTVWEPSRFAGAFWLARAYALTRDEKFAAAFWSHVESWAAQNPVNMGPNWKCGQEASLRAFAWLFAMNVFLNSPETTAARLTLMFGLLIQTARRVAANIDYAISQKNNHGLSEAAGLFTIGTMLPFVRLQSWERRGRAHLEKEARRQIYDDGSFVQHSMNYHRVMLHDCLWAMRLADLNGRPLSDAFRARIAQAATFLFEMIDPATGRVPNYGGNDGALILPLDACDYTDYRPVVQAAMFAATGRRVFEPGPHDETGRWLFGGSFLESPVETRKPASKRFDAGGYYTVRGRRTWAMVRCHSYRDRPAHVDPLHVDLWADGVNLLSDSGTYKYFCPDEPEFERFFKDIAAHNTIEVGGRGPLDLVSRFLWIPWPKARCLEHSATRFVGEHEAYNRPPWHVVHRRSIELMHDDEWLVVDELQGTGTHDIVLRWHLADGPFTFQADQRWIEIEPNGLMARLQIDAPEGFRMNVRRGEETAGRVMGWQSVYYGERTPRPTVELYGRGALPLKLTTRISLGAAVR